MTQFLDRAWREVRAGPWLAGSPRAATPEGIVVEAPAAREAPERGPDAAFPPPDLSLPARQDDPPLRRVQEERLAKVWKSPRDWRHWSDVNNTEVGVWYTATSFAFMLFAGVLGLLMRVQIAVPDDDFLTATI